MSRQNLIYTFKSLLIFLISFAVYYFSANFGLEFATLNKQASPVWPATGVAMSLFIFLGPRVALGIFAGAFLSNFQTGLPMLTALSIAVGNTLESFVFYQISLRVIPSESVYGVHAKAIFGILICVLATLISATVGIASLWASSILPVSDMLKTWVTWWVGDLLGGLFFFPIAYKMKITEFKCLRLSLPQIPQLLFGFILASALAYFVFLYPNGEPFLFLIFLAVLVVAYSFDSVWVYLLSFFIGAFSIHQTTLGNGPFSGSLLNDSLIHLQIFLAGLSVTAMGIGSLKQEGLNFKPILALIFGWLFSGMTFYFSYTSTALKEHSEFKAQAAVAKEVLEGTVNDYIRMLESGVSFFNASEYVSRDEWSLFAKKILSTNKYAGIEGFGVIFSQSISERFKKDDLAAKKYQSVLKPRPIPNLRSEDLVISPEDHFIISYIEPELTNKYALGVNISSEKSRYQTALLARDEGHPILTGEINIMHEPDPLPGFLIYVPIYKNRMPIDSVKARRVAFIGFVYAPVVFEHFLNYALAQFKAKLNIQVADASKKIIDRQSDLKDVIADQITIAGRTWNIYVSKGESFHSSTSLVSSWIGFFGTLISVLLAIILSSLQNLSKKAQQIAFEMTKEVNERRRTWQALTETSPVGIYLTDINGACTYVNSAWMKITGLSMPQAAGDGWSKALHPEDVSLVQENWQKLISGQPFFCNYRFVHRDGTVVHVTGQATSLRDERGQVTGYFGTVQDVTELYQNQMALVTSSRMSSLGQMASGIAHEINNPLMIIQGKAALLERMIESGAPDPAKAKQYLSQISATVQRIAKIIRGLQNFARETSRDPFELMSLRRAIDETLELCRERFRNHDIQLILPKESEYDVQLMGRTEQISQVLLNLLNNAHDAVFGSQEKWVRVEARKNSNNILIAVSDSGQGIPLDIQAKIFDPFFTTKDVGSGTGLGLSISKGIIHKHGGKLYLDNTKSNTTFVFEIPILERRNV